MLKKFNMNRKCDLIGEILGEYLLPLGFSFRVDKRPLSVRFFRKYKDVGQKIRLCFTEINTCYINAQGYTSNSPTFGIASWIKKIPDIPLEDRPQNNVWGWEYAGEEEFVRALKKIRKHLELYVVQELNSRCEQMNEIRVTTEAYDYLDKNLDAIIREYRKQWEICGNTKEKQLDILTQKIDACKMEKFNEIQKTLANIAAIYGDIIIEHLGGVWGFVEYSNNILVDYISQKRMYTCPLQSVIDAWSGIRSISEDFYGIETGILEAKDIPKAYKKSLNTKRIDCRA